VHEKDGAGMRHFGRGFFLPHEEPNIALVNPVFYAASPFAITHFVSLFVVVKRLDLDRSIITKRSLLSPIFNLIQGKTLVQKLA
jgi:hypothetical protein